MASVGRLFAIAAIVALVLGLLRWPRAVTTRYVITIGDRGYGLSLDYFAFFAAAIFTVCAAAYYWFPILFLRSLTGPVSVAHSLHFWLSALGALGFLVLAPTFAEWSAAHGAHTFDPGATKERGAIAGLVTMIVSVLLFLAAQAVFIFSLIRSAMQARNAAGGAG